MADETTSGKLTLAVPVAELVTRPEFIRLSDRRKDLVLQYLSNGRNEQLAARVAYKTTTPDSTRVMAIRAFQATPVQIVLALALGLTLEDLEKRWVKARQKNSKRELAKFLAKLEQKIHAGKLTVAEVEAIKLFCKLRGWDAPKLSDTHHGQPPPVVPDEVPAADTTSPSKDAPRFAVGQIAMRDGKRYRVLAVDDLGRPVEVDPIPDEVQS